MKYEHELLKVITKQKGDALRISRSTVKLMFALTWWLGVSLSSSTVGGTAAIGPPPHKAKQGRQAMLRNVLRSSPIATCVCFMLYCAS
jgi:hypothetical protein